jgi:hypothetical protein
MRVSLRRWRIGRLPDAVREMPVEACMASCRATLQQRRSRTLHAVHHAAW